MTGPDLAGKPPREPGRTGRGRRTRDERKAVSAATRQQHWAARIAATTTVTQALRVMTDRATTVAVQAERRVAARVARAAASGDQAAKAAADRELAALRSTLTTELNAVIDALAAFADRHQITRI
jgi:hypothetical protein